ncbi:BREX-1 system adenine-specific DNA-methyltransferase PglX [Adlercreutzia aquisgranensis]|uniref:BREX-1 system adenine-specific DNA-methyltransferase PglX n=1 Tax=Adlercreutzia aquisgranensis TaxID=2941323 RepID=UPI0020400B75|nr:BREX-1 system adenine-specific DNA-methyltransferase PglX [Adlercreutzia aquisgranensis]
MNDTAIKNFCVGARRDLLDQVRRRMADWDVRPGADPAAESVHGRLLSPCERSQRARLLEALASEGEEGLADRAAYTWFNRLMAIRYMELNDLVPCGVRVLSANDGSFAPQVLRDALQAEIAGIDRGEVLRLVQSSDDEALFRYLLLAVCNELAQGMPGVFEAVGSEMELLLPKGLLREGSVVQRLVDGIPEEDWRQGVEIVGWMYQYYVSERKDEVFADFKKGKKAEADAIAPATQLFTPDWIVQYLVQNSLGRLWVRSHPGSPLPAQMPYYVPDDLGAEGEHRPASAVPAASPASPELLRVIDPACGSGHILVYAFRLLAAMYEEAGYARRDIPRMILENNLTGCEIDPRAAQIASFALTMTACEWDPRYLRRDDRPSPDIVCLRPAALDEGELEAMPYLADRTALLEAMAHMGECGSLFAPEPEDIEALHRAHEELGVRAERGDLFAHASQQVVARMIENCEPLAREYDAVIANPPYMGAKNMNKWLSDWAKKCYPDVKGDLFSCFIERNLGLSREGGQLGFMTPYVWMFIGTYEKLRHKLIEGATITSLVQLEYSGFAGATVPICTFTLQKGCISEYQGGYVRLSDFVGAVNQAPRTLEAIANPSCGWFYRRSAEAFTAIPGTPIAYWVSESFCASFSSKRASDYCLFKHGMSTSDNNRFLRQWFEVASSNCMRDAKCSEDTFQAKWFPYLKGGSFRRWYGNYDYVVNWYNDGEEIKKISNIKYPYLNGNLGFVLGGQDKFFSPGYTWSSLSSSRLSMRKFGRGFIFDAKGQCFFSQTEIGDYIFALYNSNLFDLYGKALSPTLDFNSGVISQIPVEIGELDSVIGLGDICVRLSKKDYDSFESSWDFVRHPLV